MAAPQCMSNDGKQAVFIGTFMQNGDSVALCEDCLPAFTASVTADMFGVEGPALLTWLQENQGEDAPGDESTAAELAAPPAMLPDSPSAGQVPEPAPADTDAGAADPTSAPSTKSGATSTGTTTTDTADTASKSEESPPDVNQAQADAA